MDLTSEEMTLIDELLFESEEEAKKIIDEKYPDWEYRLLDDVVIFTAPSGREITIHFGGGRQDSST